MFEENYVRIGGAYLYFREVLNALLEYVGTHPEKFSQTDGEALQRAGAVLAMPKEHIEGRN